MFVLQLFRLLFGVVSFRAEGGFPERFINLCARRGIGIRDVGISENVITAKIDARRYKLLRPIAKASGMRVRASGKKGLPFFLFRHRDRGGLVLGAAFFAVFMATASLFIWNVETAGSCAVPDEQILQIVRELGVYPGAFLPHIVPADVNEQAIIRLSGKASWVAVNIKGSRAVIEVREYVQKRDDETFGPPCNIVADFDGLLLSLEVYNGQKANFEGGGVKKGDMLISGIAENRDASSIFMEARGKITAIHDDDFVCTLDLNKESLGYTRKKEVTYFSFFGLTVPLGFFGSGGEYDEFYTESRPVFGGRELPFWIRKRTRAYFEPQSAPKDAYVSLLETFTNGSFEKYRCTTLLGTKTEFKTDGKIMSVTGHNRCIDFMGEKQLIDLR